MHQVDYYDIFKEGMLGSDGKKPPAHERALLFVDNSGADIVLGILPLTIELLQHGTEVSLVLLKKMSVSSSLVLCDSGSKDRKQ